MSIFFHRFFKQLGFVSILGLTAILSACDGNAARNPATSTDTKSSIQALPSDDAVVKSLQQNLVASGVNLTVKSAMPTDMPNIYWVMFDNAPPMFADVTGTYLIQGQIAKVGGDSPIDITASIQSIIAKELLSSVNKDEMIIYPANGQTKAVIYTFTDPSCHYCRKLHSEINDITNQGVEVRYLAWPRSEKYIPITKAIWCSPDRKDALTRAKKDENITAPTCNDPVSKHLELGRMIGVNGTPAIFSESGIQIGGYLPADDLVKMAIKYR